jgi:large subunit ribosomal protein L34e
MVSGKHKSNTLKKVFVRTPGGKTTVQYRKRKPSAAECSGCGIKLSGVPRERPCNLKKIPRSARRPERPFGGVLCSSCSRKKIIELNK